MTFDYMIEGSGKLIIVSTNDKSIALLESIVDCFKLDAEIDDRTGVININFMKYPQYKEIFATALHDTKTVVGGILNKHINLKGCFFLTIAPCHRSVTKESVDKMLRDMPITQTSVYTSVYHY